MRSSVLSRMPRHGLSFASRRIFIDNRYTCIDVVVSLISVSEQITSFANDGSVRMKRPMTRNGERPRSKVERTIDNECSSRLEELPTQLY